MNNLTAGNLRATDQKKYFELYRYGINKLNKPNNTDGPTSCHSLFMPNSILHKTPINFTGWTQKYFKNQLRHILAFNYYFPNGNVTYYFDYYMLEKFKSLPDDNNLNITKNITDIRYNDYESEGTNVKKIIDQFYNKAKEFENYKFKNGLTRFIFYFELACRSYNNNGKLEIREKSGDFFVYKFKTNLFLENLGSPNEGVKTNGFLGQLIRYFPLKQSQYDYNGNLIPKQKHLIWRDAHMNCMAYNDQEMIKEFNKFNDEIYLVPASIYYEPGWNDTVICNVDGSTKTRSAVAGWVQAIKKSGNEWFNDELYINTIGMPFIVNNKDSSNTFLPLEKHKPWGWGYKDYEYGIDEYVISSFFENNEIIKKSIYLDHHYPATFLGTTQDWNIIHKAQMILASYLLNKGFDPDSNLKKFVIEVEKLRSGQISLTDDEKKIMRLILAIFPSKYMWISTCQSPDNLDLFKSVNLNDLFNDRKKVFITDEGINPTIPIVSEAMLKELKIDCLKNIFTNSLEWCKHPYVDQLINNTDCDPSEYISGFYDENPPILDLGIIRQPSDLKHAIDVMKKNKLKIPLNKTDYKLKTESDKLKTQLPNTTVDNSNGNIKNPTLTQIVSKPNVSNLFNEIKSIGNDLEQPLIWKSLNFSEYDIPPEWFKTNRIVLDTNDKKVKFNQTVKKLSQVPNWTDDTMKILLNDPSIDLSKFQMEKWRRKYLKYKQKYFNLNNNLLNKRLENLSDKIDKKLKQIELNEKLGELETTLYSEIENMSE